MIIWARTVDQLHDDLGAARLRLSEAEVERLSEVSVPQLDDYPCGTRGIVQRHRPLTQEA